MSKFDYDPGDTPAAGSSAPRPVTSPGGSQPASPPAQQGGLPPGTGPLNPAALETHARISAQDRQRLMRDLSGTGSLRRSIKVDQAPVTIKQFLRGEIDLDTELARRFAQAPLMTTIARSPQDARPASRATAMLSSQDGSAILTFDVFSDQDVTEATFTLNHMLALRFHLENLSPYDRRRWLELVRRDAGVAFLWTGKRWDDDYFIFVLRPHYVRLYAFSPQRFEASVRLTHAVARQLINWLETRWGPQPG
ncbi:MAG: hypothetical protein IT326_05980 [Anaerolineae bacterium]|nr:hypothetical protein [Anaerolineae bacterium]